MKKIIALFLLVCGTVYGQASYKGTLDIYPIELVTHVYSDGPVNALYAYSKYDTPITINGELKNRTLTLFETNKAGDTIANFTFTYFNTRADVVHGLWKGNGKQLEVRLQKQFDLSEDEPESQWYNRLLLMSGSTAKFYFKEELTRLKDDWTSRVTAVNIYEKGTDKLVQRIPVECQLWGINAIQVGDFNFDGLEDFSVFEQSYAGANTSSLYFLFDKKTGTFFNSGFEGTTFDFDQEKKLVYEHNSCCMNTSVMNATYKVVNNKLVVVEKRCLQYDEATGDYKEINCD